MHHGIGHMVGPPPTSDLGTLSPRHHTWGPSGPDIRPGYLPPTPGSQFCECPQLLDLVKFIVNTNSDFIKLHPWGFFEGGMQGSHLSISIIGMMFLPSYF